MNVCLFIHIFSSSGVINSAVWMYHMDANYVYGEKACGQLHKNAASNIEQVVEATPHKAAAVRLPTTYHETIQIRRIRHAGPWWRGKDELISDVLPWTPSHG